MQVDVEGVEIERDEERGDGAEGDAGAIKRRLGADYPPEREEEEREAGGNGDAEQRVEIAPAPEDEGERGGEEQEYAQQQQRVQGALRENRAPKSFAKG